MNMIFSLPYSDVLEPSSSECEDFAGAVDTQPFAIANVYGMNDGFLCSMYIAHC